MDFKEELDLLLNNFIIYKGLDRDNYYKIKSKIKKIREFATNKLGCDIIVNSSIIKLEKIPSLIDNTFRIDEFDKVTDYIFLVLIIMFLEDKPNEYQFIFSNLLTFIENNIATIKDKYINLDFKDYQTRKSLTDTINYTIKIGVIKILDGEIDAYREFHDSEALYENTGISHYIVRQFKDAIWNYACPDDFLKVTDTEDLLNKKRYYTYRTLLFYPVFHFDDFDSEIISYFKNYYNRIKNDIDSLDDYELLIFNKMALVTTDGNNNIFPNSKKNLHDIILLLNKYLTDNYEDDIIILNKIEYNQLLIKLHNDNKKYFNKEFREMRCEKFIDMVTDSLEKFKLLKIVNDNYKFSPVVHLICGAYSSLEIEEDKYEQLMLEVEE